MPCDASVVAATVVREYSLFEASLVALTSVYWRLLFSSSPPAITLFNKTRRQISGILTFSAVRERSSSIRLGNSTSSLR